MEDVSENTRNSDTTNYDSNSALKSKIKRHDERPIFEKFSIEVEDGEEVPELIRETNFKDTLTS